MFLLCNTDSLALGLEETQEVAYVQDLLRDTSDWAGADMAQRLGSTRPGHQALVPFELLPRETDDVDYVRHVLDYRELWIYGHFFCQDLGMAFLKVFWEDVFTKRQT